VEPKQENPIMGTAKQTAVAQAVDTLTKKAPSAGRSVKPQTPLVKLDVSEAGAKKEIAGAVVAQAGADKKWQRSADILWMLDYRPDDLTPLDGADKKAMKRRPEMKGRKEVWNEKGERVLAWIKEGFPLAMQRIMAAPLQSLDEFERKLRIQYQSKASEHMATIKRHLKTLDAAEGGEPDDRLTLGQAIAKILKKQNERIKTAKADKIDFDDNRVRELLNEAIAELT
jgi:hypothetical protein